MSVNPDSVYSKWKAGELEWHIDKGILRNTVLIYCEFFEEYQRQRDSGKNYINAVEATAELKCTSPDTIRRAIAEVS